MISIFSFFFCEINFLNYYSQPLATQAGIEILKKGGNAAVSLPSMHYDRVN